MSAFILSQEHISAMLQAIAPHHPGDGAKYRWDEEWHPMNGHHEQVGQVLVDQNYRSVNYRYSEDEPAPKFRNRMVRSVSAVELIVLCDCYEYQSCETPDWRETEAHAIYTTLRERAIRRLPGHDEADWTFDPHGTTPEAAKPPPPPPPPPPLYVDEGKERIRAALKRKTGKSWSVTSDRGTASGWIRVAAPPARRVLHEQIEADPDDDRPTWQVPYYERVREVPAPKDQQSYGYTSLADCRELAAAFGIEGRDAGLHYQGISISPNERRYYVEQVEA